MAQVPRGIRNNNPLNIRKGDKWRGTDCEQTDPAFVRFTSMVYGLRAAFIILWRYIKVYGCTSLPMIIGRWAPPAENRTDVYVTLVSQWSGIDTADYIDFAQIRQMVALVRSMARVECGRAGVDDVPEELVALAYKMVCNEKAVEINTR